MRTRCALGDRVLLPYVPGPRFVTNLLACLYAGTVPVPVPAADGQRDQIDRTAGILADCGATAVLTELISLPAVHDRLAAVASGQVACLATDGPDLAAVEPWWPIGPASHDLALLQYTSGSTSDPKGVMVGQDNLVHNLGLMRRAHGWNRDTRFGSWLPGYHDMGLIAMLLAPLYLGGSVVLMPATDFLKRPRGWLELIDRYDVAVSCAPNFAYELCARRIDPERAAELDLSRWAQACNGAEPVDALTLARFRRRFAAAGFRAETFLPGYGLAESTLYVCGAPATEPPVVRRVDAEALQQDRLVPLAAAANAISLDDVINLDDAADPEGSGPPGQLLVSCGVVADDLDVRVVDPGSCRVLPDGEIGEIWIRGGSVARGYWERPQESRRSFGARTADGEGDFLRTGDLGAFTGGQLYVTGRLKEMVILNGRNLYPHDVEREVDRIDPAFAGRAACVFAVTGRQEEMVVLQEIRGRGLDRADFERLSRLIRTTLSRRFGVRVANVVLVRPGRIRRTTSGKLQRGRMRRLFETGALEALHEDLDPQVRRRYRIDPEPVPVGIGARTEEPA